MRGQLAGLEGVVLVVQVEFVGNLCHVLFPLSPSATLQAGRRAELAGGLENSFGVTAMLGGPALARTHESVAP